MECRFLNSSDSNFISLKGISGSLQQLTIALSKRRFCKPKGTIVVWCFTARADEASHRNSLVVLRVVDGKELPGTFTIHLKSFSIFPDNEVILFLSYENGFICGEGVSREDVIQHISRKGLNVVDDCCVDLTTVVTVTEEGPTTFWSFFPGGRWYEAVTSGNDKGIVDAVKVREAKAVSVSRDYLWWEDNTITPAEDWIPFHRQYSPAHPTTKARVRRFPHRNADVIGEIPFGLIVDVCGVTTDPFTNEEYVLVMLPTDPHHQTLADTYRLTTLDGIRWQWGWSKHRSSTGVQFLRVVDSLHGKEGKSYNTLTSKGFFTPAVTTEGVEEGVAFQVYSKIPPDSSSRLRYLSQNEICEGCSFALDTKRDIVYIQWKNGGYSLFKKGLQTFFKEITWIHEP